RTPAEWALSWVWNHPEVSVLLSGMNTMEQVEENLRIADEAQANALTEKDLNIIEEVKGIFNDRIKVNCTACGYCMPCPSGVNIPTCFNFFNNFHVFGREENYNRMLLPKQKASGCIECGKCESHCPQNIAIRKVLKDVKAVFEPEDL
ncbi:MAG TPA: aldo/keto reductase, partial [Anaerovoracaceae bacterium]|nr:aldo/keto reductase [Anaerovoracaceae bacterium]